MSREILTDSTFELSETEMEGVDAPESGVVYTLRAITLDKQQAVYRQFPGDKPANQTIRQNVLLDYAIVDWRGVTNHGEPVPCTKEYKRALPPDVIEAIISACRRSRKSPQQREESFRAVEDMG